MKYYKWVSHDLKSPYVEGLLQTQYVIDEWVSPSIGKSFVYTQTQENLGTNTDRLFECEVEDIDESVQYRLMIDDVDGICWEEDLEVVRDFWEFKTAYRTIHLYSFISVVGKVKLTREILPVTPII